MAKEPINYLELSDEELMKMTPPPLGGDPPVDDGDIPDVGDQGDDTPDDADNGEAAADAADTDDADDSGDGEDGAAADERSEEGEAEAADAEDAAVPDTTDTKGGDEGQDKTKTADVKEEAKPDTDAKDVKDADETKNDAIDYKAAYDKLTAPFKANGREIAVKNVDDAIALMQMGANYNKKMAALKPNLKLLKLLENSGLLSEDKISYLIDLSKGNTGAINKLVSDSKIDPMDLSAEKASEYKQTTYAVDEREMELDTVLSELQDSPAYNRTLEIVSNKWDRASKQVLADQPALLKVINDHVERGIYDVIIAELENERMLGRLSGMSELEAYRTVGDAINARGGFNHLAPAQATAPAAAPQGKPVVVKTAVVAPKPKVTDDRQKDKRRAASSTSSAPPASTPADFNPLTMSDEEFMKIADKRFS